MDHRIWEQAYGLVRAGRPFALATVVRCERPTSAKPGAQAIIEADGTLTGWVGGSCAGPTVIREALKALRDGEPRFIRLGGTESAGEEGIVHYPMTCHSGGTLDIYVEPHLPRPQLLLIGCAPVVETLARAGQLLDFRVVVVDRAASQARFPEADMVLNELDLSQVSASPQTFAVVATLGSYDEDALAAVLATDAPYVALVASRKRAGIALDYLRGQGVPAERLERVRSPAGLDIGAVSPDEIAISILAEIIQARRSTPVAVEDTAEALSEAGPTEARDPICGMLVDIRTARYTTELGGETFYFCCAGCKTTFDQQNQ
jgi:xanthine dehydrogenase accessory factor